MAKYYPILKKLHCFLYHYEKNGDFRETETPLPFMEEVSLFRILLSFVYIYISITICCK